jgi:hypothetical protein
MKGFFKPKNKDKYIGNIKEIIYRSGWELKYMLWLDDNPEILFWSSEEVIIKYHSPIDRKIHNYFVDFWVKTQKKEYIIEIKPLAQTKPPKKPLKDTKSSKKRYLNESLTYVKNKAKWTTADAWAKKHNMSFKIITENELKLI